MGACKRASPAAAGAALAAVEGAARREIESSADTAFDAQAMPAKLASRLLAYRLQPRGQLMMTQPILLGAVTGLASSVHCAAMCGPLAASSCSRGSPRVSLARYQLGRMVGYGAAGALAGGMGHVAQVSSFAPWLAYIVPAMTVVALLMLARRVLGMGKPLIKIRSHAEPRRSALFAWLARVAPRDPSVIGLLTALLPCAALGAALLLAAATGTRSGGALLMMGFAATSALGVLGGGLMLSRATQLGRHVAPRALAALLVCAALYIGLRPVLTQLHAGDAAAPAAFKCH